MKTETKQIFWLDGFEGKADGGYYLRNGLVKFFETLGKNNLKPVAIVFDGTWNLEILVEQKS